MGITLAASVCMWWYVLHEASATNGLLPDLATGMYHTCALLVNGSMKCWGSNAFGQLGLGATIQVLTPATAPLLNVGGLISQIATGRSHTCALLVNGSMKCWGYGADGQLGYNSTTNVLSPTAVGFVAVGGLASQIAAGFRHTCALLVNGSFKCWGGNSYGQLGLGTTVSVLTPSLAGYVNVGGLVSQTVAGDYHTCALLVNGVMKCWGYNYRYYGQLGYGTTTDVHAPAAVGFVGVGMPVARLVLGYYHTCALLVSGPLKCWGHNFNGQLGYNTTTNVLTPASVSNVVLGGNVSQIAAGQSHTCAVLVNGSLQCWGKGSQLGNGATRDMHAPGGLVPLNGTVASVAAGMEHTCVVLTTGGVQCFGGNSWGQLGYGDSNFALSSKGNLDLPTLISAAPTPSVTATKLPSPSARPSPSVSSSPSRSAGGTLSGSPSSCTSVTETPSYSRSSSLSASHSRSSSASWTAMLTRTSSTSNSTTETHTTYASFTTTLTRAATHLASLLPSPSYTTSNATTPSASTKPSSLPPTSPRWSPSKFATPMSSGSWTASSASSPSPSPSITTMAAITPTVSASVASSMSTGASGSVTATFSETPTTTLSETASTTAFNNPEISMTASQTMPESSECTLLLSQFMTESSTCTAATSSLSTSRTGVFSVSAPSPGAGTWVPELTNRTVTLALDPPAWTGNPEMDGYLAAVTARGAEVILSPGLPPMGLTLHVSGARCHGMTRLSLDCTATNNEHILSATIQAGNVARMWLWKPIGLGPDTQPGNQRITCIPHVDITGIDIISIAPVIVNYIGTRWAEMGDILTVERVGVDSDRLSLRSMTRGYSQLAINCSTMGCGLLHNPGILDSLTIGILPFVTSHEFTSRVPRPSTLTVPENATLVIASHVLLGRTYPGQTEENAPGPYSSDTRVYVGGVRCEVTWVAGNGHLLAITAPRMVDVCADTSNGATGDCGYRTLRIEVPTTVGPSLEDNATLIGTSVQCPPVCPGTQPPNAVVVPFNGSEGVLLTYAIQDPDDGSVAAIPVSTASSLGLYFTAKCTAFGYESLGTDICTNVSHPDFHRCPFGAGAACSACPSGAMCPGGFRAWPLPGYFTPAESSGIIMTCPAPLTRCAGWDVASGQVACGAGYLDGSYMCTSCAHGYYVGNDGTCNTCPLDSGSNAAALLHTLIFVSSLLGAIGMLYLVCFASLRALGGSTHAMHSSFTGLLVWTFATLQTVGQLGKDGSVGLPPAAQSMYAALLAFQFEGATLPAACTGTNPLEGQIIMHSIASACVLLMYIFYTVGALVPSFTKWVGSRAALRLGLKGALLGLSVAYVPVLNGVVGVLTCSPTKLPARTYLGLQQDGSALVAAGIFLPHNPTRAQLDALIHVSLLVSDPSQVCYESLHVTAYRLAWLTTLVYICVFPIALVTYVRCRTRARHSDASRSDVVAHTGHGHCLRSRPRAPLAVVAAVEAERERRGEPRTSTARRVSQHKRPSTVQLTLPNSQTIESDAFLRPFLQSQYAAPYVSFVLLDACLQCGLVAMGALWQYPNQGVQNGMKATILCLAFAAAACAFQSTRPFRVGSTWKTHVRSLSLLLCALGAIENALLIEDVPDATGSVSSRVTACAYMLIGGTAILLFLLLSAFLATLFAEQRRFLKQQVSNTEYIKVDSAVMKVESNSSSVVVVTPTRRQSSRQSMAPTAHGGGRALYNPRASQAAASMHMMTNPLAHVGAANNALTQRNMRISVVSHYAPTRVKGTSANMSTQPVASQRAVRGVVG